MSRKIFTRYLVSWQRPSASMEERWEIAEQAFDSKKKAFAFGRSIYKADPGNAVEIIRQKYILDKWGHKDFIDEAEILIEPTHEDFKKLMRTK